MTLSLGSLRGLSPPSSIPDSEAGRITGLCFFSHHGDKKLSQIFAYDFTREARQGRLDWKEEHLQKHIWNHQPKEGRTLVQGPAGKGAFFPSTPSFTGAGSRNLQYIYTFSSICLSLVKNLSQSEQIPEVIPLISRK